MDGAPSGKYLLSLRCVWSFTNIGVSAWEFWAPRNRPTMVLIAVAYSLVGVQGQTPKMGG